MSIGNPSVKELDKINSMIYDGVISTLDELKLICNQQKLSYKYFKYFENVFKRQQRDTAMDTEDNIFYEKDNFYVYKLTNNLFEIRKNENTHSIAIGTKNNLDAAIRCVNRLCKYSDKVM